jgi:hypothetical protein
MCIFDKKLLSMKKSVRILHFKSGCYRQILGAFSLLGFGVMLGCSGGGGNVGEENAKDSLLKARAYQDSLLRADSIALAGKE